MDRRHDRRALSPADFARLLACAKTSTTPVNGLAGYDRYVLYCVAAGTGLRASELASLSPASFLLDAQPPVVRLRAAYAKNKQQADQLLPPALVPLLREYLSDKPKDRPVWKRRALARCGELVRKDLAAAELPYETEDGFADFHALRTLFITSLYRAGVHPKLAQVLARHSDVRLTLGVYTKVSQGELVDAVGKLVSPLAPACITLVPAAVSVEKVC